MLYRRVMFHQQLKPFRNATPTHSVNFLCLLMLVLLAAAPTQQYADDPEILGETFSSCVEVIEVWPEPYSFLRPSAIDSQFVSYEFRLKFSRPIFISYKDSTVEKSHPDPHGNFMVFLSPSSYKFIPHKAHHLGYWQSSRRVIIAKFRLQRGHLEAMARRVFLVVDGGAFYTYEKIGQQDFPVFAPLAIYGEYYFREEDAVNKTSVPIQPSFYCNPRTKRRLPVPFPDRSEEFSVHLPERGHQLEAMDKGVGKKRLVLQLSATIRGKGSESIVLPKTVVAQYNGVNVTVQLPPGNMTFENTWLQLHIPVDKKLVFELRERIFNFFGWKNTEAPVVPQFKLSRDPLDHLPKVSVYKDPNLNIWRVAIYNPDDDFMILNYFAYYTGSTPIHPPPANEDQLEWLQNNGHKLRWVVSTGTGAARGSYYIRVMTWISHGSTSRLNKVLKWYQHICPVGSKRNQYGRYGLLFHTFEFGSYYHMLLPRPVKEWIVKTKRRVVMTAENGTQSDLTKFASFGGENGDGVPPKIIEALRKYVCLGRPLSSERLPGGNFRLKAFHLDECIFVPWELAVPGPNQEYVPPKIIEALRKYVCLGRPLSSERLPGGNFRLKAFHLDECIFVPWELVERQECGGLKRYEDLKAITELAPDFCEKKFGECTGLPYTERFPVIPTYGLEELTGWFPSADPVQEELRHPLGRHNPHGKHMFSRSVLMHSKDDWIYLTPFISSEIPMPVKNVPLSGVKVLEPYLSEPKAEHETEGAGFCDSVWRVEPTIVQETEANLVATVYNAGKGGGDFVFEVRCSPDLLVSPSWGRIQQWIHALSEQSVQFRLGGRLAVSAEKKVHKCEVSVEVETAPDVGSSSQAAHNCTMWINTYYGAFQHPCTVADTPLPKFELVYYQLPASQRVSSEVALKKLMDSPVGKTLTFVKAITVSFTIPKEDEELLFNLHSLKVFCTSPHTVVMQEDQLLHGATQSAQDTSYELPRTPLSFFTDLTTKRKMFFFAENEWWKSQNGSLSSSSLSSDYETSGCKVEVWANRPHRRCSSNPQLQATVHVPLTEADLADMTKEVVGQFWFLAPLYGHQTKEVSVALILCLVTSVVLIVATASGHGALYLLRKKLPREETVKRLKQQLERAKKEDKRYWEDPQKYLTSGLQGPYYLLHSFKATGPLDTKDIKNLRIAGTLRYKSKELQVMFGHVKKVFVNKGGKSGNVWLQASSGMYLLSFHNVAPDYKTDFEAFLQKNGVSVEEGLDDQPHLDLGTSKNSEDPKGVGGSGDHI